MSSGVGWNVAARELRAVFESGPVGDLSDGQLLERFVADREGSAFGALVARHGSMVWGVCRRVLGDHHDAEDAFQATFLILARNAATVRPPGRVGAWLHGVASRTARKARATRSKRRVREGATVELEPGATPNVLDERLPILDRELGRLPEKYRAPIVLCELEGMTHHEAANRLGWPIGTVSGRLSRGRTLLADRLRAQGLAPESFASLAGLARAALPARLTALASVAADWSSKAGLVPAEVLALAGKVVVPMLLAKVKLAVAVLAPIAILATAVGLLAVIQGTPKVEVEAKPKAPAGGPTPAARALILAKLETARAACEAGIELYRNARVEGDDIPDWSRRWMEGQLRLAANPAEKLAAIRDHVERLKGLEAITEARINAAREIYWKRFKFKYHRLEAEQTLVEAQAAYPEVAIPGPFKDPKPARDPAQPAHSAPPPPPPPA